MFVDTYTQIIMCMMLTFYFHTLLIICTARCLIPAARSRVVIGGVKRWPFDVTDGVVPHGEDVIFFCKHPRKQCSLTANQTCFDGELQPPSCYLGKTQTTETRRPPVSEHDRRVETFCNIDAPFFFIFQSPRGCSLNSSLTGWSQRLKRVSLVMWSDDPDA